MTSRFFLSATLVLWAVLATEYATAEIEKEVLPPEQAFRFSARMADADVVEVRYAIADGYYLYRDKFKFSTDTPGIELGTPTLPAGKMHEDEFFGSTETYRGNIVIHVPISDPGANDELNLKTQFQGCADVGICYTPQTRWSALKLAMAGSSSTVAGSNGVLSKLKQLSGDDQEVAEEEFLPVEKAFRISVKAADAHTLIANLAPASGYYLYREKTGIKVTHGEGVSITRVTVPRGEKKIDPNFGDTEVFHRPFQATAKLARLNDAAQPVTVEVSYQGCSEKGLCYPPTMQRVNLELARIDKSPASAALAATTTTQDIPAATQEAASGTPVPNGVTPSETSTESTDESARVTKLFATSGFWSILLTFFGFGLLLAFTPCMFPMIPILSGIIVGQGTHLTRSRAVVLSGIYVLGMAITYAAAGVAAGLSGSMLSAALQNAWVLGAFAVVFVALALSMFGFYDLQLPTTLQTRLTQVSNKQRGGTVGGVFIMGVLSALIVGPCVAAPLAGALVYISHSRDVLLGGAVLFSMALGMGAPLLLVGWSAGSLLPKAGAWMQAVKSFFGVLLLAVAIWLISPIIPTSVQLLLWAALLIISAVYLHAVDALPAHATGFKKLWKGVGVIALLFGAALLVGALSGARDPLRPLAGLRASPESMKSTDHGVVFERVRNVAELDQRIAVAKGRPVMLDFYADWCVSCKEMERFTFSDSNVRQGLARFVLLQADVTKNTDEDHALLERFGLFGPPGIIFFSADGRQLEHRVIGYQPPEKFLRSLTLATQ